MQVAGGHSVLVQQTDPDAAVSVRGLVKRYGHVTAIGNWVLDGALGRLAAWDEEGRHLPRLFVNAAGAQFTDELPPTERGHRSASRSR